MAKQNIEIEIQQRTPGKGHSGKARRSKLIPSIIYGPKIENVPLLVKENDAAKYTRREFGNAIITLKSEDARLNGLKAIIKSSTRNPLNQRPVHIDFYAPDMTKSIRVNVELNFIGKAAGLSEGGVFSPIRRNVEVECLPTAIPENIAIDINNLGLNQTLHVYDIVVPAGVKIITSGETPIANCAIIKEEEVVVAAAPDAAAAGAAPAAGAEGAAAGAPAAPGVAAPEKAGEKKDAKKDSKKDDK